MQACISNSINSQKVSLIQNQNLKIFLPPNLNFHFRFQDNLGLGQECISAIEPVILLLEPGCSFTFTRLLDTHHSVSRIFRILITLFIYQLNTSLFLNTPINSSLQSADQINPLIRSSNFSHHRPHHEKSNPKLTISQLESGKNLSSERSLQVKGFYLPPLTIYQHASIQTEQSVNKYVVVNLKMSQKDTFLRKLFSEFIKVHRRRIRSFL